MFCLVINKEFYIIIITIISTTTIVIIIMAAAAAAGRSLAGKPGRLKWTDKMNQDLLECREKALSLKSSSNPPCYQNGRKKGYMRILKDLSRADKGWAVKRARPSKKV